MKKAKKRVRNAVVCAAIVAALFLLGYSCASEPVISVYETNVNRITEIDYSKRQAELDALVEEGKMNVNYLSKAIFQGKVSRQFNIKNIQNNHHPIIFQIYNENGECIYTSNKIEPGYEMNQIELQKELSKGTHKCKLQVGYAEEGNVSSAFPLTIEVR